MFILKPDELMFLLMPVKYLLLSSQLSPVLLLN